MQLIQEAFQARRDFEDWDEDDGEAMGEILALKTKFELHPPEGRNFAQARLMYLTRKYKGLSQANDKYPFFETMLSRVVQGVLRPTTDLSTNLCNLTSEEGKTIGTALAPALATNLTAEAAVDEWILRYPALTQLDREEPSFRPMMDQLGARLLGEVAWGTKFRVTVGASLSILDLVSDLNVVILYLEGDGEAGLKGYAMVLLAMVVVTLLLQILIAYIQANGNRRELLVEAVLVVSGLKPAVDAYRVSSNIPSPPHHLLENFAQLTYIKCIGKSACGVSCLLLLPHTCASANLSLPTAHLKR